MAQVEQLARAAGVAAGAALAIAAALRAMLAVPATAHAIASSCTLRFVARLALLYAVMYAVAAACLHAWCAIRARRQARPPFRLATDDLPAPCAADSLERGARGGGARGPSARGVEQPDGGVAVAVRE